MQRAESAAYSHTNSCWSEGHASPVKTPEFMMNLATTTNSAQYQHMVEGAETLQQGKKR